LKAASLWRILILYHIQFVLKRTIKAHLCSLFSHIKEFWQLLLGKIEKGTRCCFPVKTGPVHKGEPAGRQPAVRKGNENQIFFNYIPLNAKGRLKGNAPAIAGKGCHEAN
jgi:hypothetical protein